jgi:hypothetical protein
MEDISAFTPENTEDPHKEVITKKSNKKRKRDDIDEERETLKKQAKYYCSCSQQYASISKYSVPKLREFIIHKQFEFDARTKESVFTFLHTTIASLIDTVTCAEGHVQNKIEDEKQIRECLEMEGSYLINFLNTRLRLLSLLVINTINGKKEQKASQPPIIEEIIEDDYNIEKNGLNEFERPTTSVGQEGQTELPTEDQGNNMSKSTETE